MAQPLKTYFPIARYLLITGALTLLGSSVWADALTDQGRVIAVSGNSGIPACASCHGAQGEGMAAAGFPYLAGQGAVYLSLQLKDFAQGTRTNPIMAPIAKGLKTDQIEAVAAYYSQMTAPFDAAALGSQIDSMPEKGATGAWLANRGDWAQNIPACIQCHGPGGIGVGESFPAIAGLPAPYIRAQFAAWRDKTRPPGPLALMGDIAQRMNDTQISAVADYFAALPVAASKATTHGAKK